MKSDNGKTWTCYRCTMKFNIAAVDGRTGKDTQHLRCPECSLPFWSAMQVSGKVRVGIEPTCTMIHCEEEVFL